MRVLLDTHAILWFYLDSARLGRAARALITDTQNEKLVSPASFWEIAIKLGGNKYQLHVSYDQFIQEAIHDNGFFILPIEPRHTSALIGLREHHKDPFDRLLIAQAIVEAIPILSVDDQFDAYPIMRIW